jgi:hypothetical protein
MNVKGETLDLFLDFEPEVREPAAAGLPLRGSQMDATMRGPDGTEKAVSVPEFLAVGQQLTASI